MHPEIAAGQPQRQDFFSIQYYPGSDRAESAAMVTLQPGQDASSINFRLKAQPNASIEGRIIWPSGAAPARDVSITITSVDVLLNRINMGSQGAGPDSGFGLGPLPPGSYLLVAAASVEGRRYRGVQRVDVGPQGARDVAIPVEPSIDLAGSVSVEGPGAEKYSPSFVSLAPGDSIPWNAPPLRASVNKDGSFTITGVPPGVWDIDAGPIPPGGYLKSMRLGDQDVLTEDMVIRPSTTAPLKIVLATQAASIEGDVEQAEQSTRAVVLLAPEARLRHVMSFYRLAVADEKGHFEIKGAMPGRYQLYALDEFDQRSIQDPEFLKPFESAGVGVTLREGKNASPKLSVTPSGGRQLPASEPRSPSGLPPGRPQ